MRTFYVQTLYSSRWHPSLCQLLPLIYPKQLTLVTIILLDHHAMKKKNTSWYVTQKWQFPGLDVDFQNKKRTMERVGVAVREGCCVTHFQRFHDPLLGPDPQAGKFWSRWVSVWPSKAILMFLKIKERCTVRAHKCCEVVTEADIETPDWTERLTNRNRNWPDKTVHPAYKSNAVLCRQGILYSLLRWQSCGSLIQPGNQLVSCYFNVLPWANVCAK